MTFMAALVGLLYDGKREREREREMVAPKVGLRTSPLHYTLTASHQQVNKEIIYEATVYLCEVCTRGLTL